MTDQALGTWQGIPITDSVWDWMVERGYGAGARSKKQEDAESIIGPELARELEAAALRQDGFEARSRGGHDPAALVLKDRDASTGAPGAEPKVKPNLLLENDDYQQALSLIEPLFELAISEIINSQMSPQKVIEEAALIAIAAQPLKENALSVLAEAANLAKAKLQANAGVNTQELERASLLLVEYLRSTHFPPVGIKVASIGARENGPEAFKNLKDRMLTLIEPSVRDVPKITSKHLAGLVKNVVTEIVKGTAPNEPVEVKSMAIPNAEYGHAKSDYNVTPNLRSLVRRNTIPAEMAQRVAQAPQLVQRAPVATGELSPAQIGQVIAQALAPLRAEVAALQTANRLVTRTVRRAAAPPVVSRAAAQAAVGGGPLVILTVPTSVHHGLPSRRAVFSPRQVARRSSGLPLVERSLEMRPSVFRSKFQSEAQFSTAAARDLHDAQFDQPKGVISPGTPARLAGPSI